MRFFRPQRQMRRVVLYGKPGCHLCEEARELLARESNRCPIQIDEVDITSDPALFRRYDVRIPVLLIDGERELEAPITGRKLRDALR